MILRRTDFDSRTNKNTVYLAFVLSLLILGVGITGFMIIEEFNFINAFYMTVITISTVGFSEVHELSESGRIFTAFLIIFSLGTFGYIVTTITKYIVNGVFRINYKEFKVKQKIASLEKHVIVCGFGRNGQQTAESLIHHKEEVVVIDKNHDTIEKIEELNHFFIEGDATLDEVLLEAGVKRAKAIITAMPNDADNLYVILTAKELNPNLRIVSRASNFKSAKRLKRAGANNVIMPNRIGGIRMAKLVAEPDVVEFLDNIILQNKDEVNLVEVSCDYLSICKQNRTIKDLNVRNRSGANIVGMKNRSGEYIFNPSADVCLTCNDHLFVLGTHEQVEKLKEILKEVSR